MNLSKHVSVRDQPLESKLLSSLEYADKEFSTKKTDTVVRNGIKSEIQNWMYYLNQKCDKDVYEFIQKQTLETVNNSDNNLVNRIDHKNRKFLKGRAIILGRIGKVLN